jgi:hypothetical protein
VAQADRPPEAATFELEPEQDVDQGEVGVVVSHPSPHHLHKGVGTMVTGDFYREHGSGDVRRDELRAVQKPLKERYREEPTSAQVTLLAEGTLDEGIA